MAGASGGRGFIVARDTVAQRRVTGFSVARRVVSGGHRFTVDGFRSVNPCPNGHVYRGETNNPDTRAVRGVGGYE